MNKATILPAFIMLISAVSCTHDFVEVDLRDKTLVLLSPPDNYITASNQVNFWWEELDGAAEYRLQVVDSSFTYINQLMLDTTVSSASYSVSLPPGDYEWRVKALNGSSSTAFSIPRNLTVDTTSNISSQVIFLLSPAANYFTNNPTQTFSWSPLGSADDYRLRILDQQSTVIADMILQEDTASYTFSPGTYTWQVRGQNSVSNTPYSSRSITIDITSPSAPSPVLPANGDTIASPAQLSWTRDASAYGDSLFIYPDSLISAAVYQSFLTATSYSFAGNSGQVYFWRLKSRDQAGNWSGMSVIRKFRVQ